MTESAKHGTVWQNDELDAIVADYFAMLSAELAGETYVKYKHSSALMQKIERSHRSVEFKYQNISAVLDELGLPWIPGYRPKKNYQNALFSAVDRYLSGSPGILQLTPTPPKEFPALSSIFVEAPAASQPARLTPTGLLNLVKKFDPAERDIRNRNLGRAGESFVFELERKRLMEAARDDLAKRIRWVAAEDGDGAGYDILSFTTSGSESLIEVKTTNGAARTPFFVTNNECVMSRVRPLHWKIYRVHLFARDPRIFVISPPLEGSVLLTPATWRASFHQSNRARPSKRGNP